MRTSNPRVGDVLVPMCAVLYRGCLTLLMFTREFPAAAQELLHVGIAQAERDWACAARRHPVPSTYKLPWELYSTTATDAYHGAPPLWCKVQENHGRKINQIMAAHESRFLSFLFSSFAFYCSLLRAAPAASFSALWPHRNAHTSSSGCTYLAARRAAISAILH